VAIPDLIDVLKSEEALLVDQAIWALARMGNAAEKAIPSLETLAQSHKEEAVKLAAKAAVEEIKKKK
jgi:HEAT repeat protein